MLTTSLILLSSSLLIAVYLSHTPATTSVWLIICSLILISSINLPSSSWLSLTIFLIYVGGILVIFSYFVIIQPNQVITIAPPLISFILIITTLTLISRNPHLSTNQTPHTPNIIPHLFLLPQSTSVITFIVITLFLALIAVVNITHPLNGPIRPFLPTQNSSP